MILVIRFVRSFFIQGILIQHAIDRFYQLQRLQLHFLLKYVLQLNVAV